MRVYSTMFVIWASFGLVGPVHGSDLWVAQMRERNSIHEIVQSQGGLNQLMIHRDGLGNDLAIVRQQGNRVLISVRQVGSSHAGGVAQVGDGSRVVISQSGAKNGFDLQQGILAGNADLNRSQTLGACTSCSVDLRQSGAENFATLWQEGSNAQATVIQSGIGNRFFAQQMR